MTTELGPPTAEQRDALEEWIECAYRACERLDAGEEIDGGHLWEAAEKQNAMLESGAWRYLRMLRLKEGEEPSTHEVRGV